MDIEKTLAERGNTHGNYADNAKTAQQLKRVLQHARAKVPDYQSEALDMICHKLARISSGNHNHADNWHDIAGYAQLVVKELSRINETPPAPLSPTSDDPQLTTSPHDTAYCDRVGESKQPYS